MFYRFSIYALVTAGLVFFVDREAGRGTLDSWEQTYLSWLAGNSKRLPEATNLVHLTLEDTQENGGPGIFDQWPPGAIDYALILENLADYEPRSVVVEPVLQWADGSELSADILAESSASLPALTLSCVLQNDPTAVPRSSPPSVPPPFPSSCISGSTLAIPEFTGTLISPSASLLASDNVTVGFASIDLHGTATSADRVQLLARNGDSIYPSLPLSGLIAYFAAAPEEIEIAVGSHIKLSKTVRIPIDATGAAPLSPTVVDQIHTVPADALFLDTDSREIAGLDRDDNPLERIRGSLVVVGYGSQDSPTKLAAALATVQSAHYPTELPREIQQGVWAMLALLGAILVVRARRSLIPVIVMAILYITACLLIFATRTLWWPSAIPFTIIATTAVLGQMLPKSGPPEASPS